MISIPRGPVCQSCGMPLSQDEKGGGTEKGGSKSKDYCSHCYENGKFTMPDLTVNQMVARVQGMLHQMKLPQFMVTYATKSIPKLKRWRS